MAKKPRQPRIGPTSCIFDGGTPLTDEHMYANWLRNYIPKTMKNYTTMSAEIYPDRSVPTHRLIGGDPHGRRLRVVCGPCNNGWMSRLQNAAKPYLIPLITGQSTALDAKEQAIVAAWIAMTVMVAEHNDPTKVGISAAERLQFKNAQTAPPHWKIWIGDYQRGNWKGRWVHHVLEIAEKHVIKASGRTTPLPNTQTATMVLGRLYIHVASSATDVFEKWRITADGARKLVQLWPLKRNIIGWPPAAALTDRDADTIAGAFYMFVEAIGRENRTSQ
jgi:hypothetical protein